MALLQNSLIYVYTVETVASNPIRQKNPAQCDKIVRYSLENSVCAGKNYISIRFRLKRIYNNKRAFNVARRRDTYTRRVIN